MGKWKVVTGLRLSSFIPGRIKSLSFGTKHAGALRGGKKTRVLPTDDDQEPSPGALQEDRKKIIRRVYSESKIELDVVEVELGYGHRWVLNPHTPFRRRWDIMQMVILFYISIMVPVRVGFSRTAEGPAYVFEFLIDLYFDVDVVLNFLTGLENDDGALLYDLKVIGKRYLRGWFWVDFLACVPIDLILRGVNGQIECSFTDTCDGEDSSAGAGAIKLLKLLRLARLMKLLRLMRISRILNRYENQLFYIMPLINIFKLVFVLLFMGHVTGCFFYYFSTQDWRSKYEINHRESWLFQEFCGESDRITRDQLKACIAGAHATQTDLAAFMDEYWPNITAGNGTNITAGTGTNITAGDRTNNGTNITSIFTLLPGVEGKEDMWTTPFSFAERYIASMYWAFTTMTTVGYGDISATNKSERLFAILGMIVGGFLFSGIIGNISKMMEKMDAKKKAYNDKMDEVAVFLKDLPQVEKELRNKILAFYRKQVGIHKVYDTKQLLGEMPFELRSGILLHMYKGVTEKVEFLQGHLDEVFITDVCSRLVPHSTPPQTFVYQRGEEGGGMFIIVKGELWVLDLDKKSLLQRLTRNDYFGESSLLTYLTVTGEDVPKRTENVLSVSTSDLLVLSLNDLVELCKTYPHMHTSLKETHEVRGELYRSKQANAAAGAIAILQRKARRTAKDVAAVYHSHLRNIVTLKHKARMAERKGSVELVEAETKLDKILSGGRRVSKDSRPSIGSATGSGRSLREDSKESSTAPEAETGGLLSIPAGPPPDRVPMWTHAGKGSVPVASRASDGDTKPPHRPPASGAFAPKTAEELVIMEEVGPSDDVGTVIKAVKLQLGLLTQQSLELDRKVADMGAAGPAALAELRAVQAEQMGRVMDIAAQVVGGL